MTMGCLWSRKSSVDQTDPPSPDPTRPLLRSNRNRSTGRRRTPVHWNTLDPASCEVIWNHSNNSPVGSTTVATINFKCGGGSSYKLSVFDRFYCSIVHTRTDRQVQCIIEPSTSLAGSDTAKVSFVAREAGNYQVEFMINTQGVGARYYNRKYLPGPPDYKKTIFYNQTEHLVARQGSYHYFTLALRDQYENIATSVPDLLTMIVRRDSADGRVIDAECLVDPLDDERYEVSFKLREPGYYVGRVMYDNKQLHRNPMELFCLSDDGLARVEENVQQRFLVVGYDCHLVIPGSKKLKKVKCFISPRQFQVREYSVFQLISSRVFTCRVCNATKFKIDSKPDQFTLDDGVQTPMTLISSSREVLAATFYRLVQRNIGGTERFQDKRKYFGKELRKRNSVQADDSLRPQIRITVSRFNLLEDVIKATKGFKVDMWKRKFFTVFNGESGIDVGGVTRELFVCLCDQLFGASGKNGLFTRFDESPQALVHPTPHKNRDPSLKLEHYEFAGRVVGKCLYESALGNPLFVKARFTRSFLAQIIGLRVTWKHFETDDPQLYRYKVEQIRDNDINDLGVSLRFTEDEMHEENGKQTLSSVSLVPGGEKVKVTDDNKMDYLNKLAQHRLVTRVSDEIHHFLKGLHDIIPDELLSLFDEHELELLMCGMQEISFDDLRQHAQVRGHNQRFLRVVDWFWAVVGEFSQEELARLVQFVTGSSQLPPGGFKELRPPFLIAASGDTPNRLPYAHTCFNHICLPEYHSFELFRRSLMTAINEGCEGILLE